MSRVVDHGKTEGRVTVFVNPHAGESQTSVHISASTIAKACQCDPAVLHLTGAEIKPTTGLTMAGFTLDDPDTGEPVPAVGATTIVNPGGLADGETFHHVATHGTTSSTIQFIPSAATKQYHETGAAFKATTPEVIAFRRSCAEAGKSLGVLRDGTRNRRYAPAGSPAHDIISRSLAQGKHKDVFSTCAKVNMSDGKPAFTVDSAAMAKVQECAKELTGGPHSNGFNLTCRPLTESLPKGVSSVMPVTINFTRAPLGPKGKAPVLPDPSSNVTTAADTHKIVYGSLPKEPEEYAAETVSVEGLEPDDSTNDGAEGADSDFPDA